MKSFKVNARVKVGFNDKKNLDEKGNPTLMEVGEVIENMDRDRFDYLKSLGLVEEDKSFKDNKNSSEESKWE